RLVFQAAARRLEGLLDAAPVARIFPAMIGTADAARLDEAVIERAAAVGALLADAAIGAVGLAEDDERFAQHGQAALGDLLRELGDRAERLPIAPEQRPGRRARTHTGQPLV